MANSTIEPVGSAPAGPGTKPSLTQALRSIFSKSEDADQSKVVGRRRRFVMAAVLGTLSLNFLMFLRFFYPRALYEPKVNFRFGCPSGFLFSLATKLQNQ